MPVGGRQGRGPLAPSWPFQFHPRPLALDDLAQLLVTPAGIAFTLASLDAQAFALVQLAAWHGGALPRDRALVEAPPARCEVHELVLVGMPHHEEPPLQELLSLPQEELMPLLGPNVAHGMFRELTVKG